MPNNECHHFHVISLRWSRNSTLASFHCNASSAVMRLKGHWGQPCWILHHQNAVTRPQNGNNECRRMFSIKSSSAGWPPTDRSTEWEFHQSPWLCCNALSLMTSSKFGAYVSWHDTLLCRSFEAKCQRIVRKTSAPFLLRQNYTFYGRQFSFECFGQADGNSLSLFICQMHSPGCRGYAVR